MQERMNGSPKAEISNQKTPKMKHIYPIVFVLFVCVTAYAQDHEKQNFRIVSYNVENYFDVVDDSLTSDEEYLPEGLRAWNIWRELSG